MSTKYNILSALHKCCQLIFFEKIRFFFISHENVTNFFTLQRLDKEHLQASQTLEWKVFHHDELVQYLQILKPR